MYKGNKVQMLRVGKGLGGTMSYTCAEAIQIDAWQRIGNQGWTWESLVPLLLSALYTVGSHRPSSTLSLSSLILLTQSSMQKYWDHEATDFVHTRP